MKPIKFLLAIAAMGLLTLTSHAQSTLTNGLVAYYPFNGNANDAEGTNNGTIYGGVVLAPDRFGSNNSAYVFNGVDGYIDIGNPIGNSPSNLTESAWVKIISRPNTPYGYPPVDVIITKRETAYIGSSWPTLGIGSASSGQNIGEGEIIVDGDNYYDPDIGTTQTPTNVWFFICGIKSNNTYQIYINGALENTITDANTVSSVEDMYLMHHGVWGTYCHGVLDDVRIYNRALSSNEVAQLYAIEAVPPTITSQPTNVTVNVGGTASFSVTAGGTAPLSYQWSFGTTNIAGATNTTLTLTNVQLTQAGNYSVLVTNIAGSTNSVTATLTVNAPGCDPPPSGLVAWWRGENNTLDSVGTNNGSFLGSASYTNGEVGNAMLFNGVNNGVVVPASASLNVGTGNGLTIEVWVNPSEITPGGKANPVVEWNEGNGSGYGSAFWLTHPSVAIGNFFANLVDTSGGNHVIFSNSGLITTNIYQHVAVTYDKASGTAALYYNGVQVAVDTTFGAFTPQTTYPLYLGERPPGDINSWVFSGSMDEISIYNRALSSNEIAAIYLAGSEGKCVTAVPPFITIQPTNVTVNVGDTASFNVSASGTAPLSYQWSFNTTNILNATNATLTLTNVQLTQAGNYSVVVTNIAGSTNSVAATLTINAPSCDPPPSDLVSWWAAEGNALDQIGTNNGTLIANASYGPGEVEQAFSFNSAGACVNVPDAPTLDPTNALTLETWMNVTSFNPSGGAALLAKDGVYSDRQFQLGMGLVNGSWVFRPFVSVSAGLFLFNGTVSIQTNTWYHVAMTYDGSMLRLFVNGQPDGSLAVTGPLITSTQPLRMGGIGFGPWDFQGRLDEVSLYNRALSSNEIAAIYLAGSGGKCVTAMPPFITIQPTNVTVNVGDTASFNVSASGTAPLSYQWSFNTTNILNATNVTLTLTNVQLNQAGNYSVLVTNIAGSTNSIAATLTVLAVPPTITAQPTNQTVQAGGTASFTVTAAGTPPLAYQWSFGTTNIAGATNATLTLTNVQLTQAGNYSVLVTNIAGSTNSSNATLSVVTTLDHFAWDTIPSPQGANQPFGVTITAKNVFGVTVTNFAGAVSLQASSAGALTNSALVLNGDFETGTLTNWTQVTNTYGKFVTNNGTVIPPGASGAVAPYAGSYSALGDESGPGVFYMYQDISIPPGVSTATLSWAHCVRNYYSSFNSAQGFQVRICDTNNNILAMAFTTSPGGTLLGNWVQTNYDVTAFAGTTVRVMFWVDSTYSYIDAYVDSVSLQLAANISIAPASSGSFVNGVWSGNITVPQPATNVVLAANDGSGHAGSSNPFNVVPAPPVITSTISGASLQLTWPVSSGTFQLQSADSVLGPWNIVPPLTIATNGANVTVTVEATNQQQYFRLIGQ